MDSPMGSQPAGKCFRGIPRRWAVVTKLMLGLSLCYSQRTALSEAAVAMKDDLGWSNEDKGQVLSAFFWGYTAFMLPSSVLVHRIGGHRAFGWCVLASSLCTALLPYFAHTTGVNMVCVLRAVTGIAEAACFPAIYALLSQWVKHQEMSSAVGFVFGGELVGNIIGFGFTGYAVDHPNILGWERTFYILALAGALWSLAWALFVGNSPDSDCFMTRAELQDLRKYSCDLQGSQDAGSLLGLDVSLNQDQDQGHDGAANLAPPPVALEEEYDHVTIPEALRAEQPPLYEHVGTHDTEGNESPTTPVALGPGPGFAALVRRDDLRKRDASLSVASSTAVSTTSSRPQDIPWRLIFHSGPVWPLVANHAGVNWFSYTMLTELPSYMTDQLDFDLQSSGFLLVGIYISQWLGSVVGGVLADYMIEHNVATRLHTRKIIQCGSLIGSGILLSAAAYQERAYDIVGIIVVSVFIFGLGSGGWRSNFLDIAPKMSSPVYSVSNTFANITGILVPLVAAAFTSGDLDGILGWHGVFLLSVFFNMVAAALWLAFCQVKPISGL